MSTPFFMPANNLLGAGALADAVAQMAAAGFKKAFIVTDKPLNELGYARDLAAQLAAVGIDSVVFDDVRPNPTVGNVNAGLVILQTASADCVVSLGGGSPHDCAKGIALLATNGGRIEDYEGLDKSARPQLPLIAVNTTAGTASEMTRFAVITDTSRHVKMAIADWRVTPGIAIDDPVLMVGMPPALTAATGMDALTHAVEAFVSTIANPMTDACAVEAMKLIFTHLRKAVANGQDLAAREGMCFAQYLAGMAFNNASLGYVHSMAHQLGGFYNLPHGECNALLLPYVEKFNLIAKVEKFAEMAAIMGENTAGLAPRDAAELALKAIRQLSTDVGIPANLVELGRRYGKEVKAADIPTMTANAQKDICRFTNPRCATDKDVADIYTAAL